MACDLKKEKKKKKVGVEIMNGSAEKEDVPTWGKSIPVDNVQEMVRRDPTYIPERYIRNPEDMPDGLDLSPLSSEIPVIDLSLLSSRHEDELRKLDKACRDWGFFQIINHGVAEEVLKKVKTAASNFFELPLDEKKKYAMAPDDIQGYGQLYVVSEQQKLDWADALVLLIYPSKYRKINYWPTTPPELKDAIEVYSAEVRRVSEELIADISMMMGMDKDRLLGLHKEGLQALRVNYYPTCCRPDQVLGVSPHSDASTISILLQDDEVTGLQIRHNGGWVLVKPIPNALVVNIGDVIEIWSNGKYKSIEHRAVTNENKARISLATFITPEDDVEIEPLDLMVGCQQHLRMYKKIKYGDYLRHSMMRKLDGKAHTNFAKFECE